MTIRSHIDAAALNEGLDNLQECARQAPEGTYEDAKALAHAIDDAAGELHAALRERLAPLGLKVDNCDGFREIEAVIYGMLKAANPDATVFPAAEGFGFAAGGGYGRATGECVIAQAASNRDALRAAIGRA